MADTPTTFDAAAASPIRWRGPNLYTLVDGSVAAGVGLRVPGEPWNEDYAGARAKFTSPTGSTVKLWLERGSAAPEPVRGERAYRHEYPLAIATGTWRVVCDVALGPADAALLEELTGECAELSIEFEPDDRAGWALEVEPSTITMEQRSTATVRYSVTNRSAEPLDAMGYHLEWRVEGADSMNLASAFGNGAYSSVWHHLPTGETISAERIGIHLADAPGNYVISLHHLDRELGRATLHVTP